MYIRERQFLREFPDEIIAIATQSASNVYISPDKKRLLYTATAAATIPEGLEPDLPSESTQPETRILEPGGVYVYDREEDKNFQIGTDEGARTRTAAGADLTAATTESDSAAPEIETSTATATATQVADAVGSTDLPPTAVEKLLLATDLDKAEPRALSASPSAFTTLQASTSARTAARFRAYYSPLYNPSNFQWYPNSKHLLYTTPDAIRIKEYDNTNDTVLFSGPFEDRFVYPWPNGSKLVILTSFRPDGSGNLYGVEIK
jgi:hypothetical protein